MRLFYVKFNAEFNELSFFLKATESGQKMAKLKWCGKKPIGVVRRLRLKYYKHENLQFQLPHRNNSTYNFYYQFLLIHFYFPLFL